MVWLGLRVGWAPWFGWVYQVLDVGYQSCTWKLVGTKVCKVKPKVEKLGTKVAGSSLGLRSGWVSRCNQALD